MSDETAMALAIAADQLSEAHRRIAELEDRLSSLATQGVMRVSDEHFDVMRAVATAADLKTENAALKARIAELTDERDIYARTLDKRDKRINELKTVLTQVVRARTAKQSAAK